MAHPVKGMDHVFLLVNDLEASREAYARMGFTVSPRGLHSAQKGSANHTIMLQNDYFELLGLIAETEGNADRRAMLARSGEGLHALACRIDDAAAARDALAAEGISTTGLSDFARPVPLPGGGEAEAAFSTLQFAPEETPLGICFMCQHRTPDTVWIPELMEHANGAQSLAGIVAACQDPEAMAARFARLFAAGKARPVTGGRQVETGPRSAPLLLLTQEALARRYPEFSMADTPDGAFAALMVRVADLSRARATVAAGGFRVADAAEGFAVGPKEASGTVLEFVGP